MKASNSNVPAIVEEQDFSLAVREIVPKADSAFIARCEKAGLSGEGRLETALAVIEQYKGTQLRTIVRWIEDGMNLTQITECLELQNDMPDSRMSVPQIMKYRAMIQFRVSPDAEILESIEQIAQELGGKLAFYRIFHYVDEVLDGDIIRFYHLCNEFETCDLVAAIKRSQDPGMLYAEAYSG